MAVRERLVRFRSFWIFPILAFFLLYLTSRAEGESRLNDLFWLMPIGVLIWTLLEYTLHRFVFHIQLPLRDPRMREIVNASQDRKSTRLNSSHTVISYAVFCLKKKNISI